MGAARISYDNHTDALSAVSTSDEIFVWQLMTGLSYQWNKRASVFSEYRYFTAKDPKFTNEAGVDFESEITNHQINFGVRFTF
jgi:opacity protein-like surface antigen